MDSRRSEQKHNYDGGGDDDGDDGGGGGGGGARFDNDISPRDALSVQGKAGPQNALAGLLYDPEEPSGPCL